MRASADYRLFKCRPCGAVFLPQSAVDALGKKLGGQDWNIGQSLASLVVVPKTLTGAEVAINAAALVYLLLS